MTATTGKDNPEYLKRKRFFGSLLTIYGRKPVLEALQQLELPCYRLHLADSNRSDGIVNELIQLAENRNVEIVYHSRQALSRISKNSKQDQGVAADILCPNHLYLDDYLKQPQSQPISLIALDGITNPQNLGMIIRSVAASPCNGLILPHKGNADITPLAIKASAGSIFKCTLLHCETLREGIDLLVKSGIKICVLSADSKNHIRDMPNNCSVTYVLGNESTGVSKPIRDRADLDTCIPMANGVESLNVAITAALLAFKNVL